MASIIARTGFAEQKPRSSGTLAGLAGGAALALLGLVGRKLLVQAPTALAGDWDKALAMEHRATLKLFDKLARTRNRQSAKRKLLLTQLKHALGKHALQEENAIYPAMRDAGMLADADGLNSEHGYVKQYLYDISALVDDNHKFQSKLHFFRSDIEKHMDKEERTLFPRLRSKLTEEQNKTLKLRMNKEGLKLA